MAVVASYCGQTFLDTLVEHLYWHSLRAISITWFFRPKITSFNCLKQIRGIVLVVNETTIPARASSAFAMVCDKFYLVAIVVQTKTALHTVNANNGLNLFHNFVLSINHAANQSFMYSCYFGIAIAFIPKLWLGEPLFSLI